MRSIAVFCAALTILALVAGCAGRGPQPAPAAPAPPPPPPSAWTDADSRQVADELIGEALKRPWISEFRDRTGQAPLVRIGAITERSQGAVDVAGLAGHLARALDASGRVHTVDAASKQAPDFVLQGTVGEQDGQDNGEPVKFYQIDLKLIDAKSGDAVCPLPIEKRKDDKVVEPAKPAAQPAPAGDKPPGGNK